MTSAVPARLEDLTVEWLAATLRRPVTLKGVERIGGATGFLGVMARLHLDDGAIVAKLPTPDPGGRAVGQMLSVWARESAFYAELAPLLGQIVPLCHYNGADPEADRWCLLLEDLGESTADQIQGATADEAHRAVSTLADVHHRFASRRPVEWLPGFDRPGIGGLQGPMRQAIGPFTARYGDRVPARTLGWLAAFVDDLPGWAAQQGAGPLTLVHADYRLDNLMLTASRTAVIDWQTALWGPGPMDLASFLATSLTVEDRRRHEADLIAAYADGTGLTTGAVEAGYRSCLCWWMAIFANNLSRIDPDAGRATELFDLTVTRTFAAADDLDAGRAL